MMQAVNELTPGAPVNVIITDIHPADAHYRIRHGFFGELWKLISWTKPAVAQDYFAFVVADPFGRHYHFSRAKCTGATVSPMKTVATPPTTVTVHDWYVERTKACHVFRVNGFSEAALKTKFNSLEGLTFQKIDGTERVKPATDPTTDLPEVAYPYFD